MNPIIRPAQVEDLKELLHLLYLLFSIEEDFKFDAEKQTQGLELLLTSDHGNIIVAEVNNKVVGMATGQLLVSTAEGKSTLLIEDVVVAPDYQKRGLGHLLLEGIADWGRSSGAHRMQLLADKNNTTALNFYAKEQWQVTQLICLRKYNS